jgi:hypothetical protein
MGNSEGKRPSGVPSSYDHDSKSSESIKCGKFLSSPVTASLEVISGNS